MPLTTAQATSRFRVALKNQISAATGSKKCDRARSSCQAWRIPAKNCNLPARRCLDQFLANWIAPNGERILPFLRANKNFCEKSSTNPPAGAENPIRAAEKMLQSSVVSAERDVSRFAVFFYRTVTVANGVFAIAGSATRCSTGSARADCTLYAADTQSTITKAALGRPPGSMNPWQRHDRPWGRNSSSDKGIRRRVCEIYIERGGQADRSSLRTHPSLAFERLREERNPFRFGFTTYGLEPRQMGLFANKRNVLWGIAIISRASEQRIC
jgi:hypothetical protein